MTNAELAKRIKALDEKLAGVSDRNEINVLTLVSLLVDHGVFTPDKFRRRKARHQAEVDQLRADIRDKKSMGKRDEG